MPHIPQRKGPAISLTDPLNEVAFGLNGFGQNHLTYIPDSGFLSLLFFPPGIFLLHIPGSLLFIQISIQRGPPWVSNKSSLFPHDYPHCLLITFLDFVVIRKCLIYLLIYCLLLAFCPYLHLNTNPLGQGTSLSYLFFCSQGSDQSCTWLVLNQYLLSEWINW